ncbi:MAG: biopolymer transporter ExbD [Opitutales bacterium]
MSLLAGKRKRPRIDIVPLVDVLRVLIVFFLVTMQFKNLRALNVRMPKIETAGSNQLSNEITLSLDRDGNYFLHNQPVTREVLQAALQTAANMQEKPKILLVADEDVALKEVTRLIDMCRESGLDDFRLQSR